MADPSGEIVRFQAGSRYRVKIRRAGDRCTLDLKLEQDGPATRAMAVVLRTADDSWSAKQTIASDGQPSEKGEEWVRLVFEGVPSDGELRYYIVPAVHLQSTRTG